MIQNEVKINLEFFSEFTNILIFSDDGGWRESGSTLAGWLTSSGAGRAVTSGLAPTIAGVVGSFVTGIVGDLPPIDETAVSDTSQPGQENDLQRKALEGQKALEAQIQAAKEHEARLCAKYNTTPDKLRDVMRASLNEGLADAEAWNAHLKKVDIAITVEQATVVVSDVAIDGLANVTGPVGKAVRAGSNNYEIDNERNSIFILSVYSKNIY